MPAERPPLVCFSHCERCRTVTTGLKGRFHEHHCRGFELPDGTRELDTFEVVELPVRAARFVEIENG